MPMDAMVSPREETLEQGLADLDQSEGEVQVRHINKKKEDDVLRSPVQASIAKVNCVQLHLF